MAKLPSKDYWIKRATNSTLTGEKVGNELVEGMNGAYKQAIQDIETQVHAFYGKYAKDTGMDLADVMTELSKKDFKSYQEAQASYISMAEGFEQFKGNPTYMAFLKNQSGKAYVTKMDELSGNLKFQVEKLADANAKGLKQAMVDVYDDSYSMNIFNMGKGIGVNLDLNKPSLEVIEKAVATKWSGLNYSDNIWKDKNKLMKELDVLLPQEFILGKGPDHLAEALVKRLNVSKSNALRIARTELSFIANQATLDSYKSSGFIDDFEYLATLDNKTSEICQAMDGKHFKVSEGEIGINVPPLHPYCRSTTIPYFPEDDIDIDRIGRNKAGKSVPMGKDMTYEEWVNTHATPEYKAKIDKKVAKNPDYFDLVNQKIPTGNEVVIPEGSKKAAEVAANIAIIDTLASKEWNPKYLHGMSEVTDKETKKVNAILDNTPGMKQSDFMNAIITEEVNISDMVGLESYQDVEDLKYILTNQNIKFEEGMDLSNIFAYKLDGKLYLQSGQSHADLASFLGVKKVQIELVDLDAYAPKFTLNGMNGIEVGNLVALPDSKLYTALTPKEGIQQLVKYQNTNAYFNGLSLYENYTSANIKNYALKANYIDQVEYNFKPITAAEQAFNLSKEQVENLIFFDKKVDDFMGYVQYGGENPLKYMKHLNNMLGIAQANSFGTTESKVLKKLDTMFKIYYDGSPYANQNLFELAANKKVFHQDEIKFYFNKIQDKLGATGILKEDWMKFFNDDFDDIIEMHASTDQTKFLKKMAAMAKANNPDAIAKKAADALAKKADLLIKANEVIANLKPNQKIPDINSMTDAQLKKFIKQGFIPDYSGMSDAELRKLIKDAKWYTSRVDADADYKKWAEAHLNKATEPMRKAAHEYTAGSGKFNRPLSRYSNDWGNYRPNVDLNEEGGAKAVNNLYSFLDQSQVPDTIMVRRGGRESEIEHAKSGLFKTPIREVLANPNDFIGKQFKVESFLSTGIAEDAGFHYTEVEYRVILPAGTKASYVEKISSYGGGTSYVGSEAEVIIQANTSYLITNIKPGTGSARIQIEMMAIPDSQTEMPAKLLEWRKQQGMKNP